MKSVPWSTYLRTHSASSTEHTILISQPTITVLPVSACKRRRPIPSTAPASASLILPPTAVRRQRSCACTVAHAAAEWTLLRSFHSRPLPQPQAATATAPSKHMLPRNEALTRSSNLHSSPSYDDSSGDGDKHPDHPFSFPSRRAVRGSRPLPTTVE
jgi:hypothetical protein